MRRPPAAPTATPDPRGWHRLAWAAYERLPRSADGLLSLGTRALLPFTNARVPLTIVRGPVAGGGSATVVIAGTPEYLVRRFFPDTSTSEPLGSVPIWQLGPELARHRATADLVVARLDRISAALVVDAASIAVPEWVGALAPVPVDPSELCRSNKSLRHNLGRMRRAGFVPLVSHEPRDFEDFYDHMYLPFIRRRHGAETMTSNRHRMRRCFRQGGMIFAVRDGQRVAGVLYRTRGRTFDLVVMGTADGDLAPLRDGAAFALDLFAFEHARAVGCEIFDFGGSRPSPTDGLLLYKARWDARVVLSRTLFYELRLSWDRLTPTVLALLAPTPLIIRQADGLAALWVVDAPNAGAPPDLSAAGIVLQSLRRLYVLGAASRPLGLPPELPVIQVDPVAHPTWHPPARAQP